MNTRRRFREIPGFILGRYCILKMEPINARYYLGNRRVRSKKYNGGKRITKPASHKPPCFCTA